MLANVMSWHRPSLPIPALPDEKAIYFLRSQQLPLKGEQTRADEGRYAGLKLLALPDARLYVSVSVPTTACRGVPGRISFA